MIKRLHMRTGVTTIYVTHDQVEAMTLGSRIAVLKGGAIQQPATPLELYERPANLFVAGFIGSPAINTVKARADGGRLLLPDGQGLPVPAPAGRAEVQAGIRPEDLELRADGLLPDTVSLVESTGPETYALVDLGFGESTVRMTGRPSAAPGARARGLRGGVRAPVHRR